MLTALLLASLSPCFADQEVTAAEKKEFLKLLAGLPTRGEFYTEEAVEKAIPHTRVLLALTEKDLAGVDLYPFMALSSDLARHKEPRQYAIKNFATIAHPTMKLGWAVMLLDDEKPEIVGFLLKALDSKEDARALSRMLGPGFEKFKARVVQLDEATKAAAKVELKGKLRTGIVALGGETTGTIIETRDGTFELDFGKDKDLRQQADKLDGKTVQVEGSLTVRKGVDVKERKIVAVRKLEEVMDR